MKVGLQFRNGESGENSPILSRALEAACHMSPSFASSRAAVDSMEREEQANCEVIDAFTITALRRSRYLHSPCHTIATPKKRGQHGRICSGRFARGRIELGNTRWGTSQIGGRRQQSQRDIVTAIPLAVCVTQEDKSFEPRFRLYFSLSLAAC